MIDDVDRILVSEESITPSAGFLRSVMAAVRAYHHYEIPIPFPWRRFMAGLVGGLCCTGLSMILLFPELFPLRSPDIKTCLSIPQWLSAPELVCAVAILAGSFLAIRFSIELTSD